MQVNTTLYSASAKAVQEWKVSTLGNVITVEYGQVAGKMQTKTTTCKGKNIGKANATTDAEQALSEAASKWEKQKKKGYVECPTGKSNVLLPMKVKAYFDDKMKDKVVFPATLSPKLNGVNGECRLLPDGTFVQLSRGGEEYPLPPANAVKELRVAMAALGTDSLNYEIYLHGTHLQDINGAVRAPHNHKELWEKLQYHVFDLPTIGGSWKTRKGKLKKSLVTGKYVKPVIVMEVSSHADIINQQDGYVALGFEGSIVRNYEGLYEYNKRTMDVLKVKYVLSEEFQVLSWAPDKNSHPVYVCKSQGGDFKVKRKGTNEERLADAQVADDNIGEWLTVEFETWSKDKKPLKPVGITFRVCDTEGNPLE